MPIYWGVSWIQSRRRIKICCQTAKTTTGITILKGVHIGRGAIISAGALVINDVPPYSIVGGVPAKVLKYKWTIPEILRHEKKLYPVTDRLTEDYLSTFVN